MILVCKVFPEDMSRYFEQLPTDKLHMIITIYRAQLDNLTSLYKSTESSKLVPTIRMYDQRVKFLEGLLSQ